MSPMQLPISGLSELWAMVPNASLESSSLDAKPLNLPLEREQRLDLDHLPTVTMNAHAGVQISLFNSMDDRDADGILVPPGKDAFGGVTPSLTLSTDFAWLKYRTEVALTASGQQSLASPSLGATLGVETGASTVLTDYRVHGRAERLQNAIAADLKAGTRLGFILSDVESLQPGEAVSAQLGGTLKLSVKVTWADVFTGELAALTALTQSRALIALQLDAGAALTVNIAVADDFIVVFSRVDETTWRVGARKADKGTLGADLRASVDVSLADGDAVSSIVNGIVDDLVGEAMVKVKPILEKATLSALNTGDRAVAVRLMHRFGLDEKVATLADVNGRIGDIQSKIASTIDTVARTKISAAFTYEYRRVSTSSHVFQATLSADALRAYHDAFVQGDFQPAISGILEHRPGIALERYLHEKSVERTHSWGFTLGIGKWLSIGGTDTRTIVPVVRFNIKGERQESYLGLRSYDGKGVNDEAMWSGEFNAEMDGFSSQPLLSQFALGIHLMWRQQVRRLSEADIDVFLDAAVIWGVMTPIDASGVRGKLVQYIGRPCDATVQMIIADKNGSDTLRRTLAGAASAPGIAGALGEAMPWRAGSIGRTQTALRRSLYGPLWQAYMNEADTTPSSLAVSASRYLADRGYADLGRLELEFRDLRPYTFAGLADLNGNTPARAGAFLRALEALRKALEAGSPSQPTLGEVFGDLSGFWEQSLHVRAAGVYLLEAARSAQIFDDVQRTGTCEVDGTALVLG